MTGGESVLLMLLTLEVGALPGMATTARSLLEGSSSTTRFRFY